LVCKFHPSDQLIGDFLKDLFGEVSSNHALCELDELNDVSLAWLTSGVSKTVSIAIKLLHQGEIGTTDSDNYH